MHEGGGGAGAMQNISVPLWLARTCHSSSGPRRAPRPAPLLCQQRLGHRLAAHQGPAMPGGIMAWRYQAAPVPPIVVAPGDTSTRQHPGGMRGLAAPSCTRAWRCQPTPGRDSMKPSSSWQAKPQRVVCAFPALLNSMGPSWQQTTPLGRRGVGPARHRLPVGRRRLVGRCRLMGAGGGLWWKAVASRWVPGGGAVW